VLWGQLELPELVVQATAPVVYTYYLDLEGEWSFAIDGRRIRVTAPAIRFNKPSVDASEIRYEVKEGGLLWDDDAAIEALRDAISTMAEARAEENLELVRELGRRRTEEFVERWLAPSFGDGAEYQVVVVFADERPGVAAPPALD
jgi:hypothetical protein